tara:strand:- start:283 stop:597 length:315 start_codon:yes stop_codon:yes gene_type:complete
MIEILLASSILVNIFLMWYTRSTLKNLLYLSENLGLLYEVVDDFSIHLRKVYELERFYGDSTLSYLLEHSKAVREELEKFEEIFLLAEPPEIDEEVEPDGEEEA